MLVRLDIGCGSRRRDVIGIDPVWGNVRADFHHGLPFSDNTADEVFVYHVLQEVNDLMGAMEEIWRVCKHNALIYVRVPHASSGYAVWMNPKHKRGFTIDAFGFFGLYDKARFHIELARLHFISRSAKDSINVLRRFIAPILESIANRSSHAQYRCERWWGPWLGFDELFLVLRADKKPKKRRRPSRRVAP